MTRTEPRRVAPTPDLAGTDSVAGVLEWLSALRSTWNPQWSFRRLTQRVNDVFGEAGPVGTTTVYELFAPGNGSRVRIDDDLVVAVARTLGAEDAVTGQLRHLLNNLDRDGRAVVPIHVGTRIPALDPHFSGRVRELRECAAILQAAFAGGHPPVLCVDGLPGIGKSTLAVNIAHQLLYQGFRDARQVYVDLRGDDPDHRPATPQQVLEALLSRLGVPDEKAADRSVPPQRKFEWLREVLGHGRTVMLLDNAAGLDQVRPLLPGLRQSPVLITCRRRSDDPATAGAYTLEPMTGDDAVELLRLVDPVRVGAEPGTARHLAERLCFGHPYHLKVLGGILTDEAKRGWSLADIAKLIEKQTADDPSRQLLTATFANGLTAPAQRTFCLLALVAGYGFTPDDVAVLADIPAPEAREVLTGLHQRHLVQRPDTQIERYRLHDITAAFARRQLDEHVPHSGQQAALNRLYGDATRPMRS